MEINILDFLLVNSMKVIHTTDTPAIEVWQLSGRIKKSSRVRGTKVHGKMWRANQVRIEFGVK
jgi:hypothetical protein